MATDSAKLNNQELIAEISGAITPAITAADCYLEEVTITPAGKSRILTVIVDSDSHLNLDQVTVVSRAVSEVVEALPALGDQPFTLEVTSPGVDRPLTQPRHWRKNKGRLINIVLIDGSAAKGRIGESADDSVTIDGKIIELALIKRATIEVEFKSLTADASSEGDDE